MNENIEDKKDDHTDSAVGAEAEPGSSKTHHSGGGSGWVRHRGMLVRYSKIGLVGQFKHSEREIPPGVKHVVIHTERGLEIGEIISPFCHRRASCTTASEDIDEYCRQSGPEYPFTRDGRFVRFATEQDLNEQRHLEIGAKEEARYCQELIGKLDLAMKLVDVEHLFGGDRIVYYFMADGRVDFRSLVKQLAHEYQTRIEMRQVGARDEARLVADYETCGRQCCCKNFLKVLQPVTMRMAKLQKATLDPTKISGRCGRLKCCLRYEDEVYTVLNRKLPRNNSCVLTENGPGTVLESQVLTQLVKIRLDSGRVIAVNIDEIQERNYKAPPPVEQEKPIRPNRSSEEKKAPPPVEPPSGDGPSSEGEPRKKRRRRRRKKRPTDASSDGAGPDSQSDGEGGSIEAKD